MTNHDLSPEAIEGMVAYYQRVHAQVPCPHCNEGVTLADAFLCVDCERPYHRECLRLHCAGEIERLTDERNEAWAELAVWHESCTGKHGSQAPCVSNSAIKPRESKLHDRDNRCIECFRYRNSGASRCGNCGLQFEPAQRYHQNCATCTCGEPV